MILMEEKVFQSNNSTTNALILTNRNYNKPAEGNDLIYLVNLPELEADISIFTGKKDDLTYEGYEYNTSEGSFTNTVDKIRYLYTALCQYGLYSKNKKTNVLELDGTSPSYLIYKKLIDLMPKLKFLPPQTDTTYVFDGCDFIIDELIKQNIFDTVRVLGLFLIRGQIIYCNSTDSELVNELKTIAKNNKYSIAVSKEDKLI